MQRGQQGGLFVIIIVALRPERFGKGRILAVPGAGIFFGLKRAHFGVDAAVAERLVQPADAVVHGGDKHQVAGRPSVKFAVSEDTGMPNSVMSATLRQPIISHSSVRIGSIQALNGPSPAVLSYR